MNLFKYPWMSDEVGGPYFSDMPVGWREAFGDRLVDEINDALEAANIPSEALHIVQVKEKYGELRIYYVIDTDNKEVREQLEDIIDRYTCISLHVCAYCGKPDVGFTTTGWILPVCQDCFLKHDGSLEEYNKSISKNQNIPDKLVFEVYSSETKDYKVKILDVKPLADAIRKDWEEKSK